MFKSWVLIFLLAQAFASDVLIEGRAPSDDPLVLNNLSQAYRLASFYGFNSESRSQSLTCQSFFKIDQKIQGALQSEIQAAMKSERGSDVFFYHQARTEILEALAHELIEIVQQSEEGGVGLLNIESRQCVRGESRSSWMGFLQKRELSEQRLSLAVFGQRGLKNGFHLSNFLAKRSLENAEMARKTFLIETGVSVVMIPALALALPKAVQSYLLQAFVVGSVMWGGYQGYLMGDRLYLETHRGLFPVDVVESFFEMLETTDLETPEFYFESIFKQEIEASQEIKKRLFKVATPN